MTIEERIEYAIKKGFTGNLETGQVFSHTGKEFKGKSNGYIHCSVWNYGMDYGFKAHQFIWYLANGFLPDYSKGLSIDHVNRIRADNRLINLNIKTYSEQVINRDKYIHNNSKGYIKTIYNTFRPWIRNKENKRLWLGSFKTEEEAIAVRKAAEIQYGYRQ